MAAAGRSLKPFYGALAIIAAVGAVTIVRSSGQRSAPAAGPGSSPAPALLGGTAPLGRVLGPDSAPVEILEFSDFECPYCARFAILTMPDVRQRLIPSGRLTWRFMDFPLQGHANSPAAHLAAACAAEQGSFWQMHDALYNGQNRWASERRPERVFREFARALGLEEARYASCVAERRPWPQIEATRLEGERMGVNATPTFVVNGRVMPDPLVYDQIKAIVDSIAPVQPVR